MRKIVISAFVSLDGVMQAPGGPKEDTSGGFAHGGWTFPYWDDAIGAAMGETFSKPYALLLGRKTYDIFAAHWPKMNDDIAKQFNAASKYVATHRPESLAWEHSHGLGSDVVATLRAMKKEDGPQLLTQGSSELVHLLLENDLADELRLLTYPVVLGKGKRLFTERAHAGRFDVVKSKVAENGVVIATYERAGEVKTGSFPMPE